MYSIYDYIHNGIAFVNNIVRKQHKDLTSLMIYSTTSCQSRCKHCSIWKKPTENLSIDDIIKIMNSKCVTKRTMVGLEGGEFILHPEADKILGWFDTNHPNYTLLSNCLAVNKVIAAVKNIIRSTCIFHLTAIGKLIATCEERMDMIRLLKS